MIAETLCLPKRRLRVFQGIGVLLIRFQCVSRLYIG